MTSNQRSLGQVFLIRHANSAWNHASEANKALFKKGAIDEDTYLKEVDRVFGALDLCDCPLSAKGVDQCKNLTKDTKVDLYG